MRLWHVNLLGLGNGAHGTLSAVEEYNEVLQNEVPHHRDFVSGAVSSGVGSDGLAW